MLNKFLKLKEINLIAHIDLVTYSYTQAKILVTKKNNNLINITLVEIQFRDFFYVRESFLLLRVQLYGRNKISL